jgi:hypothetical protein
MKAGVSANSIPAGLEIAQAAFLEPRRVKQRTDSRFGGTCADTPSRGRPCNALDC